MSLMCMAPDFGLRAQAVPVSSKSHSVKWGLVEEQGQDYVPCKQEDVPFPAEGVVVFERSGKYGFLDQTGKQVVPFKYKVIRVLYFGVFRSANENAFSEGLAAVKLDDKWGFIDKSGKQEIPCKYENVGFFSEGLAPVKLEGKWGYIDNTGQEGIPCKYDDAKRFYDGVATVSWMERNLKLTNREIKPD